MLITYTYSQATNNDVFLGNRYTKYPRLVCLVNNRQLVRRLGSASLIRHRFKSEYRDRAWSPDEANI
jgi:hypothetical protein